MRRWGVGLQKNAKTRIYSIFLLMLLNVGQASIGAAAACGPDYSKLVPRTGAIPDFIPFFSPVLSRAELELAAEKIPVGTSIKKFVEHGHNTWSVEKLSIEGRPQVVAVKRSRMEGEARQETRALNLMADVFEKNGIDKYFHVVRPLETGEFHTVYPIVEGRDLRELARQATAKVSKKKFRMDDETGGPTPKGLDANVDRLWSRFQEGIEVAVKGLKKAGYSVQRVKKKSVTTGEPYIEMMHATSPRGTATKDIIGFSIRSSDILVTTDGRFAIIDPY